MVPAEPDVITPPEEPLRAPIVNDRPARSTVPPLTASDPVTLPRALVLVSRSRPAEIVVPPL